MFNTERGGTDNDPFTDHIESDDFAVHETDIEIKLRMLRLADVVENKPRDSEESVSAVKQFASEFVQVLEEALEQYGIKVDVEIEVPHDNHPYHRRFIVRLADRRAIGFGDVTITRFFGRKGTESITVVPYSSFGSSAGQNHFIDKNLPSEIAQNVLQTTGLPLNFETSDETAAQIHAVADETNQRFELRRLSDNPEQNKPRYFTKLQEEISGILDEIRGLLSGESPSIEPSRKDYLQHLIDTYPALETVKNGFVVEKVNDKLCLVKNQEGQPLFGLEVLLHSFGSSKAIAVMLRNSELDYSNLLVDSRNKTFDEILEEALAYSGGGGTDILVDF